VARAIARRPRRATLDRPYDLALADVPSELRPLVAQLADNMRESAKIRDEISSAKIGTGAAWFEINNAAHRLSIA
jgi:hypothetical protein